MEKSPKELSLEKKILGLVAGKPKRAAEIIFHDPEVDALQNYANTVSIGRLHYNDHGPVHMKKVAHNALILTELLKTAGIELTLGREESGSFEDSTVAVVTAALLHDVGMTIGREDHQNLGIMLAVPVIDRVLKKLYPEDLLKQVTIRSLVIECIIGHMGTHKIHSLEAGIILIADGCDMEKGRARIPMAMNTDSRVGDIHKYSSAAVTKVRIEKGKTKPIGITVLMTESVGFFQVEEVLFTKIAASSIKEYIELYAGIKGEELKRYL